MRSSGSRDWLVFAVLLGLSVVLGQIQNAARRSGQVDFLSRLINGAIAPFGRLWAGAADGMGAFGQGITSGPALQRRNEQLEQAAAAAAIYAETVKAKDDEIASLRAMLDMPVPVGRTRTAAPVWGFFPNENRMTIGAGRRKGVEPGLAVVAAEGLVGIVQTADSDSAQVQLICSPYPFKVGALIASKVPAAGLLHGEAQDRLRVELIQPNLDVQPGDVVETSPHSQKIPPGILIGKVVQVSAQPEFGRQSVQVFPLVNFSQVRVVAVIK